MMDSDKPGKEEYPILRIKKQAVVGPEYRYKREERLAHRTAPQEPREIKGFFRGLYRRGRRRGGLGSILIVILVVLAAVFVFRFAGQDPNRAELAGFQAVLRATVIKDSLSVSVTFDPSGGDAALVVVRFLLPETGESLIVSRILPPEGDVFRGIMGYSGKEKKLSAEVRIGDSARTLNVEIQATKVP
jgi:hypothetical protein